MLKRQFDGGFIMTVSQWPGHIEHGCPGLIKSSSRSENSAFEWYHCASNGNQSHISHRKHILCAHCMRTRRQVEHNDECCP